MENSSSQAASTSGRKRGRITRHSVQTNENSLEAAVAEQDAMCLVCGDDDPGSLHDDSFMICAASTPSNPHGGHYDCFGLASVPDGDWFCSDCTPPSIVLPTSFANCHVCQLPLNPDDTSTLRCCGQGTPHGAHAHCLRVGTRSRLPNAEWFCVPCREIIRLSRQRKRKKTTPNTNHLSGSPSVPAESQLVTPAADTIAPPIRTSPSILLIHDPLSCTAPVFPQEADVNPTTLPYCCVIPPHPLTTLPSFPSSALEHIDPLTFESNITHPPSPPGTFVSTSPPPMSPIVSRPLSALVSKTPPLLNQFSSHFVTPTPHNRSLSPPSLPSPPCPFSHSPHLSNVMINSPLPHQPQLPSQTIASTFSYPPNVIHHTLLPPSPHIPSQAVASTSPHTPSILPPPDPPPPAPD